MLINYLVFLDLLSYIAKCLYIRIMEINIQTIVDAARERADRHMLAECELHKGLKDLYGYGRIYNAEMGAFEAGAEWMRKHIMDNNS